MNFLTGRTQAVVMEGTTSNWLPINRIIVQGSGLGPMLFVVYALDLKPISEHNRLIKYADDTTVRENVCNNSKKRKKSCFFGF